MFKFLFQVGTLQTFFCRLIMLSSTSFPPPPPPFFFFFLFLFSFFLSFCIFIHSMLMNYEILTVPMPHVLRCPVYVCMYVCNKDAFKNVPQKRQEKKRRPQSPTAIPTCHSSKCKVQSPPKKVKLLYNII